ncbi:MAG TPA: N-6 DNA methylase [Anaerolineae bacterium]|nr:N-6 DNA methylase [Anaerolineae bacterium]
MQVNEIEQILFEELGYSDTPNLYGSGDIPWLTGRPIPDIHAALFLEHQPLIYFSRFTDLNLDVIRQLHRNVWSQSKAPLLFVTLPHEIRIYSGYDLPTDDEEPKLLQHLTALTDRLTVQTKIKQDLIDNAHYHRMYLETGVFWNQTEAQQINYESRADLQLVKGMRQAHQVLTGKGLSNHISYMLLGRSIFICYLEDRGILDREWIQELVGQGVENYREILQQGRETTYQLFEQLSQRFNGDLFPVNKDESEVTNTHLETILSFLKGTDLKTGQLSFWPYNFEYIPIELISQIYDTFIGEEEKKSDGAYYTPLTLVDFILEETMGQERIHPDMTTLDPACGSGIFLVGAYRRLVQAWKQQYRCQPQTQDLIDILRRNIYGVDKNEEAVRIAIFSLYLEILNHLSNQQVREGSFRFPSLWESNLIAKDFFDEDVDERFKEMKFERIVGNLPWGQNTLTDMGKVWLKENHYTVGSKQAAPAFMLRVPKFCHEIGEMALLAPVKSSILVTSKPHKKFREYFFSRYHIRAVVNFSVVRWEMGFSKSVSPSAAIFYTPNQPDFRQNIVYATPKPSPLSQHLKAIIIDSNDIKFLDRQRLLEFPFLWKIAQWGTPRDAAFIERLMINQTLEEHQRLLGWTIAEGFSDSKRTKKADWLEGMSYIKTTAFTRYWVKTSETVKGNMFERPRKQEVFTGPLALVYETKCIAAFSRNDVAFTKSIFSITGQDNKLLKWIVCLINSPLTRYYQFLTSTRWGVERNEILKSEYMNMPFPMPQEEDVRFQKLLDYFDKLEWISNENTLSDVISNEKEKYIALINQLVYEICEIHPVEKQLIEDMLMFGITFFEWSAQKKRRPNGTIAIQAPNEQMLKEYANVFLKTTSSLLQFKGKRLRARIYQNGAPLSVMSFELIDANDVDDIEIITQSSAMKHKLRELDELLMAQKIPSMYMRQHVRVYDGNEVSLVRPSEQRFWTQSQARADADEFLAEITNAAMELG